MTHTSNAVSTILLAATMLAIGCLSSSSAAAQDFNEMAAEEIKADIEQFHPSAYYILAQKLFDAGERNEAVFWFYAGQLRYRFFLAANPNLPPDQDPALFASVSEVIGRPLNEYAFGDIPQLATTIDEVLDWDANAENAFVSKTDHAEEWEEVREGLIELRETILAEADSIRAEREENGLENR